MTRAGGARLARRATPAPLLGSAVRFMLDERVRDRIIAETRGNPLALLELPRGLTATQLAGGFGLLGAQGLSGRIEESFVRRLEALSDDARRLLLLAAAEPVGDPLLLLRASEQLGIAVSAVDAETDGLLAIGERVTFRHPLVRSAVYRSASVEERRAVHLALAEATDRDVDPDRRAWHLAAAATRALTSRSRWSSSVRPGGRRRAAASPPRRRSFERAVALTRGPRAARRSCAGRGAGELPGRRVRRGARARGRGGGGAARRVPARTHRPDACSVGARIKPAHRSDTAPVSGCPTPRGTRYLARARDVRRRILRGSDRGPAQ